MTAEAGRGQLESPQIDGTCEEPAASVRTSAGLIHMQSESGLTGGDEGSWGGGVEYIYLRWGIRSSSSRSSSPRRHGSSAGGTQGGLEEVGGSRTHLPV